MTEFDSSIMTTDNGIDSSIDVMTDNSTNIMADNSQPLTRTIGKPKKDKDPNALKIASFRTKEGVWAEFSQKAESDGLTATDVLKAAMEQYLSGEYNPRVITDISTAVRHTNNGLTRDDVLEIVNTAIDTAINTGRVRDEVSTAISTLSLPSEERVNTLVSMAVDTAVSTETINSNIMTAISTLSLQTDVSVITLISTALAPIEAEVAELKKPLAVG